MLNKRLRKALLKKLGCTPAALSQRVKRLKSDHPMTSDDAAYVISHQQGIPLDKYLPVEQVNHIRTILSQIQKPTLTQGPTKSRSARPTKMAKALIICGELKASDPVLSQKKLREAKEMAAIYPLLYVLENSIRDVIASFMESKYGPNWWDDKAPSGLKTTATQRMSEDTKNSWHQRRGARPIDYLDLSQLPALMRKIQRDVVPKIIPSIEWFTQLVDEVYKSRCVICHMNPLDKDNISSVKLRFRHWQKQIEAKIQHIPRQS